MSMMNRLVLTLGLVALVAAPAAAATHPPVEITVTGQGSVTQMPDLATLNVNVASNASTGQQATSRNNRVYDALLAAMTKAGIAHDDVKTTFYNMNYNPRPADGAPVQPYVRYGYSVERGVSITIRNVNDVGAVIDAAVGAGASNVNGVSFGASNDRKVYDRALHQAVLDAQSQAAAMASAAGLHLVRIKAISQGFQQRPMPLMRMAVTEAAAAPTNIEPSNVTVSATVTVTYEAQ